jgi:hypothetical protein
LRLDAAVRLLHGHGGLLSVGVAQLVELIINGLIGRVPERPRWAMWLVVTLYIAAIAMALILAVEALV